MGEPVFKVGDRVALCASSPKDKYADASDWLPGVVSEVNQARHGPWRVRVGGGWFWEHDLEFDESKSAKPAFRVGDRVRVREDAHVGGMVTQEGLGCLPGSVLEVNRSQVREGAYAYRVKHLWFYDHQIELDVDEHGNVPVPGCEPCAFAGQIVYDESDVPLGVLLWQQGRWVLRRAGYIEVKEPLYERLRREIGGSMVPESSFVSVSDAARAAERVFEKMQEEAS